MSVSVTRFNLCCRSRPRKRQAFDAIAKGGCLMAAPRHLSFPGLGHLRALGKSYQWIPMNYTR
jgi:hypothetical protein